MLLTFVFLLLALIPTSCKWREKHVVRIATSPNEEFAEEFPYPSYNLTWNVSCNVSCSMCTLNELICKTGMSWSREAVEVDVTTSWVFRVQALETPTEVIFNLKGQGPTLSLFLWFIVIFCPVVGIVLIGTIIIVFVVIVIECLYDDNCQRKRKYNPINA